MERSFIRDKGGKSKYKGGDDYMIGNETLLSVVKNIGGNPSSLKLLGGFSNGVYEVNIDNIAFVIKFYLASQRERPLIKGELDWVNFLAQNGMNVAKPISFKDDYYIKGITERGLSFYYVLFEKVTGKFIDKENWDESLIEIWGQCMGRMHNLAKKYVAPVGGIILQWHENDIITDPPANVSETILVKWNDYIKKLSKLSVSIDDYGIIHNDLHHKNLYFCNGSTKLFDFGDCEYGWYTYDIAISLYHAVQAIGSDAEKRKSFANKFLTIFFKGYNSENITFESWEKEIKFFLNYRRIYSYLYILKHLKGEQIDERLDKALDDMKYHIENDIPYLA